MTRRRRRRADRTGAGEVAFGLLEIVDVLWSVMRFVVRIPLLLLRLFD